MSPRLIDTVLRRSSGAFVRAARARGIRTRAARTLESAANEVSPGDPARVLDSRELFQEAATLAVVGDGGNLELSFSLVDGLASTVETLGLARSTDVPDPFRRVWVSNGSGQRIRGVVLTCRDGELAVFCPPAERSLSEIGGVLWLRYRGFDSSVEYDLQLDDAVRLPGALVLHLKRRSGQGAIGRSSVRYPTSLPGVIRVLDLTDDEAAARPVSCVATDISTGGMALDSRIQFVQGERVRVELDLPDGNDSKFAAEAVVRWSRDSAPGIHGVGIAFANLPRPRADRLESFLQTLSGGEQGQLPHHQLLALADSTSSPPRRKPPQAPPTEERLTLSPSTSPTSYLDMDAPPRESIAEDMSIEHHDASSIALDDDQATAATPDEERLMAGIFRRIGRAATSVSDQPLSCGEPLVERRRRRVAGADVIHISFKFSIESRTTTTQGCLLIPLADALSMASAYMMLPLDEVSDSRFLDAPDPVMKEALLQLSELIAGAIDRELRGAVQDGARARSLGCQGVRADVRPAFEYTEGADLIVGRSETRFGEFEQFEMIAMLPALNLF